MIISVMTSAANSMPTINLTQRLVALVRMQGGIRQDQFEAMARELKDRSTLIRNVALAPGNVIRFMYPLAGNEKAIGLDYLKTSDQAGTVLRAIQEKRTVVAGPVQLVQGGVGIIGRTPIFLQRPHSIKKNRRAIGELRQPSSTSIRSSMRPGSRQLAQTCASRFAEQTGPAPAAGFSGAMAASSLPNLFCWKSPCLPEAGSGPRAVPGMACVQTFCLGIVSRGLFYFVVFLAAAL